MNPWTVLNWETGQHEPPIRSLPGVLRFLGYDPFPVPSTIGERLLQARREHGWSIREAALNLGVDPTTWRRWEQGELILYRKQRTRVAQLLACDHQKLADEMRARWNGKHRRWKMSEA